VTEIFGSLLEPTVVKLISQQTYGTDGELSGTPSQVELSVYIVNISKADLKLFPEGGITFEDKKLYYKGQYDFKNNDIIEVDSVQYRVISVNPRYELSDKFVSIYIGRVKRG